MHCSLWSFKEELIGWPWGTWMGKALTPLRTPLCRFFFFLHFELRKSFPFNPEHLTKWDLEESLKSSGILPASLLKYIMWTLKPIWAATLYFAGSHLKICRRWCLSERRAWCSFWQHKKNYNSLLFSGELWRPFVALQKSGRLCGSQSITKVFLLMTEAFEDRKFFEPKRMKLSSVSTGQMTSRKLQPTECVIYSFKKTLFS